MSIERPIRVSRLSERPKVFSRNRVCDHPGCETVLSRYNPDDTCESHKAAAEQSPTG